MIYPIGFASGFAYINICLEKYINTLYIHIIYFSIPRCRDVKTVYTCSKDIYIIRQNYKL